MVVCVVQLEHADAEYLATILKPFLSPEGSIVPYVTTNVIIIKDRQYVVDMLTKLIKGRPCTPISQLCWLNRVPTNLASELEF